MATCWPPSVAVGSGTAVAQRGLAAALARAGVGCEVVHTSRFASSWAGLVRRAWLNRRQRARFGAYRCLVGVDGEGWPWAQGARSAPYVAACKAVLGDVLPFERLPVCVILGVQACWERRAALAADAVVAASAYARGRLQALYGVPAARLCVIPEPFDVEGWRQALPAREREPLVLAVGHAYPRKNYGALLAAWPAVLRRHPRARLALVAGGPERERLRRRAAGLEGVVVAAHLPYAHLRDLYARASVFCHPSLQENFGIAVIEGLAAGLGLVAHRQPAVLENVSGLPGVWSVDARAPGHLAAALAEALGHPAPWPAERLAGVQARLDPARVGAQWRDLLEGLGVIVG